VAAVTADTRTLPRVTGAALGDVERQVLAVSTAPAGMEGEGFPVRRTMAGIDYRYLDPFIMMDHMGEVDYAAGEPKGTHWHPHRGFETVTYLIEGQFIHQDTHGGGGVITEGSTQWMTAGAGLLHIETPPEKLVEEGGLFHGFQLWVNLPAKDKFLAHNYQLWTTSRDTPLLGDGND
jgi:redox-sensitive bicupin YhaK (pirin superfamily)